MAAVVLLVGCTKEAESSTKTHVDHRTGKIGEQNDLYGIDTTVLRIEPFDQSPEGFPRLRVTVRSESTLAAPSENPDVQLRCKESTESGVWHLGSTWEPVGLLSAGTVSEGQVIVGFPHKAGAQRYPVPTCTDAHVDVVAQNPVDSSESVSVRYDVDADLIDQAIDAPRGASLPLAPRSR